MEKKFVFQKNVAGGSHDTNHVSVASDTIGGMQMAENQIVVCDMPLTVLLVTKSKLVKLLCH